MPTFSRDPDANLLAQHALAAGAAFHDELQDALSRALATLPATATDLDALDAAQTVLEQYVGPLAAVLADATLAAWLVGAGAVAASLPFHVTSPPPTSPGPGGGPPLRLDWDGSPAWLPLIDEAVRDLRQRNLVTRPQWDALTEAARARAFTVAGVASQSTLGAIRDALAEAVDTGHGLPEFRDRVAEAVGTSPVGPGHLENVFRTNTAQAMAAAQEQVASHPVVRDLFPYRMRLPILDSRTTDICDVLARSGINGTAIYRAADLVWQKTRPPSHYQCRTGVRILSREEAAERGLTSARRWLETGEDPRDFVPMPDIVLPRGWVPGGDL